MIPNGKTKGLSYLCISAAVAAITLAPASSAAVAQAAGQAAPLSRTQAVASFESANRDSSIAMRSSGSISRVYGKAFSHGATTAISAQRFLSQNAGIWGVSSDELVAQGPFADGHHVQPIGYLPDTDSYKFTGHYYTQFKDGLPVFRSKLVLLVRNEENSPLVLASSELHDLRNFQPDLQVQRTLVNEDRIIFSAKNEYNSDLVVVQSTERMIFAGVDSTPAAPTIVDVSTVSVNGFEKYLIVTDAVNANILFQENLIHTIDISGNASALASEGPGSDNCEPEVIQPLPYLSVGIQGGSSVFTDVDGNFTIPNGGSSAVTVNATLTGEWFRVTDNFSSAMSESVLGTPPGPADLLFNSANANQQDRAQVNAYIEANRVRDFVVAANPAYPQMQQNEFPINVNQSGGLCPGNAWYDGASINFCLSGGSSPNTAWSSVVHHEYGHHLVAVGGSGQGQYGEGMGDVMSTIILDDPRLGLGFFGSCNGSLRNANNNHQFPCAGGIHDCGQLISGCVWDTRQELIVTEPANYTQILNFLAVNAILVHSGSEITPQITIDWLTLDDDDSNIGNGTPHYAEIAAGFGEHNMDAPALSLVEIVYPAGQPELVSPDGSTTLLVNFEPLAGEVDPATTALMVDNGSGFVAHAMTQLSSTEFEVNFPAADCGSEVIYYIASNTLGGAAQNSPTDAPSGGTFSTIAAFAEPSVVFEDNFQSDTGWTVSGDVSSRLEGQWQRQVPTGAGERGDPANDFDGSGICFITGNGNPGANTDVDGGSTILTSPIMDATGVTAISYARWYSNDFGNNPFANTFVVEISDDAGASWANLETVGPAGPEVIGGWITKQIPLTGIAGFTPNSQFQVRFTASDSPTGAVIEAGVDAVALVVFDCNAECLADLTGDGVLNFFDIAEFLGAFGKGDLAVDFTGDGILNFFDVAEFLSAFAEGCP